MVGRLYAVVEGGLATCSGTAVISSNQSTIWTAGHCTKGKVWYRKQLFVPGQNSKNGFEHPPYGKWPISDLYAPKTWAARSACAKTPPYNCPWGSDYAALLAYRNRNGATLTSKVGALNLWFGSGLQSQTVLSLGYAASAPYFDKYAGYLFYCQNPVSSYVVDGFGGYEWRLPCNMTAGASGGPWLRSYAGRWYLVSNNSSSNTSERSFPTTMFGPYLDPVNAKGFYNYVQRRQSIGCVVPGVKGKWLAGAKHSIRRAHCAVGRVHRSYSRRLQKGRVKAQKPPRGKRYATGTKIDLVVSRGRRR
jgi:hypothetical protein